MYFKYYLPVFFFLCIYNTHAQDTVCKKSIIPTPYWTIKLPLWNFMDLYAPNLQLGLERRLDKQQGIQFIGGISVDQAPLQNRNTQGFKVNGFRFKGEYKRYFHFRKYCTYYFAGELFYTQYKMYAEESFITPVDSIIYSDHYLLFTQKYGLNIKFGIQRIFLKHFLVEIYGGLGIEHHLATQAGRSNPNDPIYHYPSHELHFQYNFDKADEYTISMPINCAIGYIFR